MAGYIRVRGRCKAPGKGRKNTKHRFLCRRLLWCGSVRSRRVHGSSLHCGGFERWACFRYSGVELLDTTSGGNILNSVSMIGVWPTHSCDLHFCSGWVSVSSFGTHPYSEYSREVSTKKSTSGHCESAWRERRVSKICWGPTWRW